MQGAVGGLTGGQGGEHVQSMQCHQQPRYMSEYGGPQQEHRSMSQQSPMTQPFHQHTLEGNSYSPPQHPERTSSIGTPGPNPRTSRPLQSKNDGSFDHATQQGRAVDASYRPPMQPTQLWPAQNVQQYQLSNGETGFFYLNKCFPRSKSAIQIPHSPMRTPTIPAPSKHARAFSDQGAGRFTQAQSPNLPNKLNKNTPVTHEFTPNLLHAQRDDVLQRYNEFKSGIQNEPLYVLVLASSVGPQSLEQIEAT